MRAVRPGKLAGNLAAFLTLAGSDVIAVVRWRDRDDGHSPDAVDFIAMPFADLPVGVLCETMPIPILRTNLKDGHVGSGPDGVVYRVNPPRMPAVAVLKAADYRSIMGEDIGVLEFIALN